jgi:general secretion pathway protein I
MRHAPSPRPARPALSAGFTLIEVLVALAIVAIALGAGMAAMASLTNNTLRQSQVLLAQVCAQNTLTHMRLLKQMPGIGESTQNCEQAGQVFEVHTRVSNTPNPHFRRVQAQVRLQTQPVLQVSTVVGKY